MANITAIENMMIHNAELLAELSDMLRDNGKREGGDIDWEIDREVQAEIDRLNAAKKAAKNA